MAGAGASARYTWTETDAAVEVRIALPRDTKRAQLNLSLIDEATGANVWRNAVETAGGADMACARARLRVAPVFWPGVPIDGLLRGPVNLRECAFQMTSSEGPDTRSGAGGGGWDGLLVTLRKAEPGTWGGVVIDETDSLGDELARSGLGANAASAGELVQTMASHGDDVDLLLRCARSCADLARAGNIRSLIDAKAFGELAAALRAHPASLDVALGGSEVLAEIDPASSVACCDALLGSGLFGAAADAARAWPDATPIQLAFARAALAFARCDDACRAALLSAHAVGVLGGSIRRMPTPARDLALAAIRALAASSCRRCAAAVIDSGAAAALLDAIKSPSVGQIAEAIADEKERRAHRLRCWSVLHSLGTSGHVDTQRSLLRLGIFGPSVRLISAEFADDADAQLCLASLVGAYTWSANSAELRAESRACLADAAAGRALMAAAARFDERPALRRAALLLLAELLSVNTAGYSPSAECAFVVAAVDGAPPSANSSADLAPSAGGAGGGAGNGGGDGGGGGGGAAWEAGSRLAAREAALADLGVSRAAQSAEAPLLCEGMADASLDTALKLLLSMAQMDGAHRACLTAAGAHAAIWRALRTHAARGGRVHLLCSALAQLSCAPAERAAIDAGVTADLVEMYDDAVLDVSSQAYLGHISAMHLGVISA